MRQEATTWGGASLAMVMVETAEDVSDSDDSQGNATQWEYTGRVVAKVKKGRGNVVGGTNDAWTTYGGSVAIYNMREMNNSQVATTASARLGNGVSHSGDYPAGFEMRPLELGSVYPAIALTVEGVLEYWTWQSNGEDGSCT